MSLITSCPSCGTMFRVVPDQLKISEGWVRCGHCNEVFDATAHLTDESVLGPLAEAQATRSAELQDESPAPEVPEAAKPAPPPPVIPEDLGTRPAALYERSGPAAANTDSEESSSFFPEEVEADLEPSPLDAPFVFRRPEISLADLAQPPAPGAESQVLPEDLLQRRAREDDEEDEDEDEDVEESVPDVSFVRQARRRRFWGHPRVRLALAGLFVVLAAMLALQVAYQDRDRMALAQPALRPMLEGMCNVFGCRLGPPRQIEAVVIDSSGFSRLRNDTYRLSFTLRNTAAVPVAAPAMELTVTDAQDQPLVRRVLTPAELGADQATIPAAGEWSRTVGITLADPGPGRVAGYRLLAFYP